MDESKEGLLPCEYEIYMQLYRDEIERRESVNKKFQPSIAILALYLPALAWLLSEWIHKLYSYKTAIYAIISAMFLFLGMLFVVIGLFCFARCFTFYKCARVDLHKVQKTLDENREMVGTYTVQEIENHIKDGFAKQIFQIALENWDETNKHSKYMHNFYLAIFVSAIPNFFVFLMVLI